MSIQISIMSIAATGAARDTFPYTTRKTRAAMSAMPPARNFAVQPKPKA
jgi:hypothetical protein